MRVRQIVVNTLNNLDVFRDASRIRNLIIPNLKRIHLLSPRVRPYYEAVGLLAWEGEKPAPELSPHELMLDCAAAAEKGARAPD